VGKKVTRCHDNWVLVITAWRVLRLQTEERPPVRRVAANILNKRSLRADKGWSSSLGVGWGANNSSPWKRNKLRTIHKESHGLGRIYDTTQTMENTCECGNEPSGSVKCGEFLDWLRNG